MDEIHVLKLHRAAVASATTFEAFKEIQLRYVDVLIEHYEQKRKQREKSETVEIHVDSLNALVTEVERLRAVNAELLEALKEAVDFAEQDASAFTFAGRERIERWGAVIAKAGAQS